MTNKPVDGRIGWVKGLALFMAGALISAIYFGWQMLTLAMNEWTIATVQGITLQTTQATPLRTPADLDKERLVMTIIHDSFPRTYCQARADLTNRIKAARLQKEVEATAADFDALEQLLGKMDRPGNSAVPKWNGLWFDVAPAATETCETIMAREPAYSATAVFSASAAPPP